MVAAIAQGQTDTGVFLEVMHKLQDTSGASALMPKLATKDKEQELLVVLQNQLPARRKCFKLLIAQATVTTAANHIVTHSTFGVY